MSCNYLLSTWNCIKHILCMFTYVGIISSVILLWSYKWYCYIYTVILCLPLLILMYHRRHVVFSIGSICSRGWEILDHKSDPFSQYTSEDYAHNHSNSEDSCNRTCYANQYPTFWVLTNYIYGICKSKSMQLLYFMIYLKGICLHNFILYFVTHCCTCQHHIQYLAPRRKIWVLLQTLFFSLRCLMVFPTVIL